MLGFEDRLQVILEAEFKEDYKAAVGVVQCGDRWLLGLAKSTDDRNRKWCMAGGGIKNKEKTADAAVREVWEETGIRCKAVGKPFSLPGKKHVAFVHCKAAKGQDFDLNSEFTAAGWFTRREMQALKLYGNVLKLLDRVC
jgi:8-oxo-dGTP pyrophosphatase MutT (NUDIX family)